MNRREFFHASALAGATAGLTSLRRAGTVLPSPPPGFAVRAVSSQDQSDHSLTRDAVAIQRSTLVVEGLAAGYIGEAHLKAAEVGGVNCIVQGGGADFQSYAHTLNFLEREKERAVQARTVHEIREARRQGKIAVVFEWQSANALGEAFNQPLGAPETPLRSHYEMGLRIIGLCYNVANVFGAGNLEPHTGLSRAGHRLVQEIHTLRMVLDVGGHTGQQTSLDAIAISSGVPVICTHTNVAALCDNPRCVSDQVIEAIAHTGGVVGLTAFNDYLARGRKQTNVPRTPQVALDKYLDQFDYIRNLVGVDHVGLGPDFVKGWNIDYEHGVNREIMTPEMVSDGTWLYVKGFEDIDELPNVTRGLIERGWSTEEIHKVLGENWLRVYEQVWGV
jgi:membrane dipeptidase